MKRTTDLFEETKLACEEKKTCNPDNLGDIYCKVANIIENLKSDISYVVRNANSTENTYKYELALRDLLYELYDVRFEEL